MRILFLITFLFSFQSFGFSTSQKSLYENINATGINHIVKISNYQANKIKLHKLGPNGNHQTVKGYNVRNLQAVYSEGNFDRQRVNALSYFRDGYAYPEIAVKIGNSLVCYASAPARTSTMLGGSFMAPRRVDMSRHTVNDFNLDWYRSEWRYCIIFPYEIDEVVEALED